MILVSNTNPHFVHKEPLPSEGDKYNANRRADYGHSEHLSRGYARNMPLELHERAQNLGVGLADTSRSAILKRNCLVVNGD